MNILKQHWTLVLLLALSIFSILPLFHPGFFPMHDDTQVVRVYEMSKGLRDGTFPVRWVEDLGYGFGYPIFNFYGPLPYYLGGLFMLFSITPLLATKFVFEIGVILSGISMYLFTKSFAGKIPSLVAAILYVYFPYHAVNIYVRGAVGEFFAYAFLPFVFWGLFKIYEESQEKRIVPYLYPWIALSGLSLALVIVSHNLSALMLLFFLIIFSALSFIFTKERTRLIISLFFVFFLGFSLSAFFALPALLEMKYTSISSQIGGAADFRHHFVCIQQLWDSQWGFGGSTPTCLDGFSFKLGKTNSIFLLISCIGMCYLFFKKKLTKNLLLFLVSGISFVFSIFLMLSVSLPFWESNPFMAYLQYPWRFLNFTGFFLCIIVALFVTNIQSFSKQKYLQLGAGIFIITATLYVNSKLFQPQLYINRASSFYTDQHYIRWTVSKISDEYMPSYFRRPVDETKIAKMPMEIIYGDGEIKNLESKTGYMKADLHIKKDADLKINIAYFPAWNIYVDGMLVEPSILKTGLYKIFSTGNYVVEAKYQQTDIERLSNLLSILGIVLFLLCIVRSRELYSVSHKRGKN